ncbi:Down syndrome cell adhesion molecule-like protein 1 isoform X2 [Ixodes scapularis]|uniref:Down syndrome cell adhesion molecule-like protein 1 isoform X2 n=1 Tax=Ixodes scapularis TaxID=6945 RepID=UPI001A9E94E5|nr:Down syndrome cell adhesion molecule-like protein 1 isoform X2 [Ixodes scapularis]
MKVGLKRLGIPSAALFWAALVYSIVFLLVNGSSTLDPPKVQPFQFPSRPQPNRRIRLTCTVTEGDPPLRFTWLKDDVELTSSLTSQEDSGDVSVDVGPESSVLVLRRLHVGDIGNYTCVVDNPAGTDKFQAFLRFPVPPFWKADPEPVEVLEGRRAVLSCSAGGYPEPQILWRRRYADGVDRAVVKTSRVRVAENSSLVLESVSRSDQGSYVCQAHNGVPPDVQRPVSLKVRAPPKITVKEKQVIVRKGETVTLVCNVTGDQPIRVTWTKDGGTSNLSETSKREVFHQSSDTEVASTLHFKDVDSLDSATYACNAANEYGADEAVYTLVVLFPPPAPRGLKATEVGTRFAHLEWSQSTGNISRYIVRHWKLSAPEASPTDVDCEPVNASSIELSWKSPAEEQWNGVPKGFYVGLKQATHSTPYIYEMVSLDSDVSRAFTRLSPNTVYSFVVRAFNSAGSGPASREMQCTTLSGDPPPAPTLYLVKTEESMVTLNWKIPKAHNASVLQYVLETRRDYTDEVSLQHFPATTSVASVTDLESSVKYSFRLAAYNRFGRGAYSNSITESTRLKFTNRFLSGNLQQESPFYMRSYFFIVIIACVTLVTLSIVISWACVKRARIIRGRRTKLASSMPPRPSLSGTYSPRWVHDPRVFDDNYDTPWDASDLPRTATLHGYTNVYDPSSRS